MRRSTLTGLLALW